MKKTRFKSTQWFNYIPTLEVTVSGHQSAKDCKEQSFQIDNLYL